MSRFMLPALAAGALAAAVAFPVSAEQTTDSHDAHHSAAATPAAALTPGEVRKVDKGAKKITLKHGPIAALEMPAMTMVYPVADAALLDGLKAGDQILFAAEKSGDTLIVTRIEARK